MPKHLDQSIKKCYGALEHERYFQNRLRILSITYSFGRHRDFETKGSKKKMRWDEKEIKEVVFT